jgi:hypothetical protein
MAARKKTTALTRGSTSLSNELGSTTGVLEQSNPQAKVDSDMTKSSVKILPALTLLAIFLSSCGSVSTVEITAPLPSSTDASAPPPSAPVPTAVSFPSPAVSPPQNRNDVGTPLGPLCWARREMAMLMVSGLVDGIPATGSKADNARKSVDAASAVMTAKYIRALPVELQKFGGQLVSDIASLSGRLASGVSPDVLATQFDFENYEGAREFVDLAESDPGCKDI